MNKNEFLNALNKKLNEIKVTDADEIVAEYEEHFIFKLADGYSEEEIAAKLGNPEEIALQFETETSAPKAGKGSKAIVSIGLVFADIFTAAFFIILYCFVLVTAALTVSAAVSGFGLLIRPGILSFLPSMPYQSAIIFAVCLISLAVLCAVGTVYCFLFVRQLMRSYLRWHKNTLAAAAGEPIYPPLSNSPRIALKKSRLLRSTALIALTVFAVAFIAGYAVSAFTAGAVEFWHVWKWFV